MAGEEDPDRRFDYLFEPLDDDEANDATGDVSPSVIDEPTADHQRSRAAPTSVVLAAAVLATIAAVTTTVVLLLHGPESADQVWDVPAGPPRTTVPSLTTQPVPVSAPTVTASVVETTAPNTTIEPEPQPLPVLTTSANPPQRAVPPSPTVRSPISVSPEPRSPFPNQTRPGGGQDPSGGGLLPGVPGLPGPLG